MYKGLVGVIILEGPSGGWGSCLSLQPHPVGLALHHQTSDLLISDAS